MSAANRVDRWSRRVNGITIAIASTGFATVAFASARWFDDDSVATAVLVLVTSAYTGLTWLIVQESRTDRQARGEEARAQSTREDEQRLAAASLNDRILIEQCYFELSFNRGLLDERPVQFANPYPLDLDAQIAARVTWHRLKVETTQALNAAYHESRIFNQIVSHSRSEASALNIGPREFAELKRTCRAAVDAAIAALDGEAFADFSRTEAV